MAGLYPEPAQRILNRYTPRHSWRFDECGMVAVICRVHWEIDGVEYLEGRATMWTRPGPMWAPWVDWTVFVCVADGRMHQGGVWLDRRDVRRADRVPPSWRPIGRQHRPTPEPSRRRTEQWNF